MSFQTRHGYRDAFECLLQEYWSTEMMLLMLILVIQFKFDQKDNSTDGRSPIFCNEDNLSTIFVPVIKR